jgi:hypothetical protein
MFQLFKQNIYDLKFLLRARVNFSFGIQRLFIPPPLYAIYGNRTNEPCNSDLIFLSTLTRKQYFNEVTPCR